jgi:hypothetical protein
MALKVNELKVVVKNDINAVSMGIIPKGQKTYNSSRKKIIQLISMLRLMWAV